ncbi:PepSY domain-containing protein [uncultured Jannaschia sp.]|uniref:PepSY domain-containing protein n=1 Tax=uncultured Jannaschia sp. TaxID=293347 RepID=UPI002623EF26|nr:PepSY domain-containing protein [uncultured Jannaschia sp.]
MRFGLFLFFCVALPAPAPADERDVTPDSEIARAAVARGEILPLSELLPRLLEAFPGEVLDIEIDLYPDGRFEEYEFEVLTLDGRLIEVDMDAATGEITDVEDED